MLRHRAHPAEPNMQHVDHPFRAPRHRHVRLIQLNIAHRIPNRVRPRSAPRANRHRMPPDSQMQADRAAPLPAITRDQIIRMQRPKIPVMLHVTVTHLDNALHPAHRRPLHHAHPVRLQPRHLHPRIHQRHLRRRHPVLDRHVKAPWLPAFDILRHIKIPHLRRDLRRQFSSRQNAAPSPPRSRRCARCPRTSAGPSRSAR